MLVELLKNNQNRFYTLGINAPLMQGIYENTTEAYLEILFNKNLCSIDTIPLINKANRLA